MPRGTLVTAEVSRSAAPRVLTTLLATLLSLAFFVAAPVDAEASVRASSREVSFVDLINDERAQHGLRPLRIRGELTRVARAWSGSMAATGSISHNPQLTRQVEDWSRVAENVGVGPEAASLHRAFMNSPLHRRNILNGAYTELGVGIVRANGMLYVTQNFRTPDA